MSSEHDDARMTGETQATIGQWSRETFGLADPAGPALPLRLLEEVAELCKAAGATQAEVIFATEGAYRGMFLRQSDPDASKVDEEIADCAIVLDILADARGLDLGAAKTAKMKRNRARTWQRRGDGTGQHIEGLGDD